MWGSPNLTAKDVLKDSIVFTVQFTNDTDQSVFSIKYTAVTNGQDLTWLKQQVKVTQDNLNGLKSAGDNIPLGPFTLLAVDPAFSNFFANYSSYKVLLDLVNAGFVAADAAIVKSFHDTLVSTFDSKFFKVL